MRPPVRIPPRHVERPRLTRLLDAADARAVAIVAPAGYGKTTLAAEWLAGKRCAWYRPVPAPGDAAAFARGLARAAATVVPGADDALGRALAAWPDDAWLVIDEYEHAAACADVEALVERLLDLSPLRLLVTSRVPPAWASGRRVLYGEAVQISEEQLALTELETAAVLRRCAGEVEEALVAQAEGWPALVGLAAIAASNGLPPARVYEALDRYFADEVLGREPP